ncbi:AAA family ATPase [Synechocystis salina LEGE 06099]|uniref:bifunctional aminoglycoside phosphotransferase/ATP-binding protein n=1 Tax=Synechocystis salina TaxID=945780 RepID=UPI00187E492D|nr:AAA family ATPase [Synechocystis salina]MBE9204733.1 AAA family ATPase [Synechocystis salina LEGE 06099]
MNSISAPLDSSTQDLFLSLLQTLQRTDFYPHRVQKPIQCLQTHCSVVFLTGKYAYKLKKPVDLGFLDYSTPAKRKHFLEEELRLNSPVAPDIYQEVLAVELKDNQWQWQEKEEPAGDNDNSQPKDYLLKMAQFPQDCLFLSLFEQGKLSSQDIIALAKRVAEFHQGTVTNAEITSFGDPEVIWQSVSANFAATEKYLGIAQETDKYQQIRQFSENFYQSQEQIFRERQAMGKIRECHGDLHLRNLCQWRGKIQLFDRIEFNQPFRFVDVMYDIAFTVMDLQAKGRTDWAYLFLNTYLEQTGDWHGLQVLPFYLCRQAYVRAKVTSFLLDDANLTKVEKEQALGTAKDYYHLAWQYSQQGQQIKREIVLMAGLSGSGKSTVAQHLGQLLPAVHIRSDAVRKHLGGVNLDKPGKANLYSKAMTEKVYHQLLDLATLVVNSGFNIILDAKFDRVSWRSPIVEFALREQLSLTIINCDAPIEVLTKRLQCRRGDISDANETLLLLQALDWEDFTESEEPWVFYLDTSGVEENHLPEELLRIFLPPPD